MSKLGACISVLAAVSFGVCLVGCQSDESEPAPKNPPPLAALENELTVAQGSLGGALDEAKACVEDFKACREADGSDCVDTLKACLPAPEIPALDGREEASACFEDFRTCQESGGADCVEALKACLPEESGFSAPPAGAAPSVGGVGFFGFGRGFLPIPRAPQSGATPGSARAGIGAAVDPAALAACRDSVSAAASGGSAPAAIDAAFKACIRDAFSDLFADVCSRITEACDGATDTTRCDRLTDACSDPALTP
jgi:hypothetical protein